MFLIMVTMGTPRSVLPVFPIAAGTVPGKMWNMGYAGATYRDWLVGMAIAGGNDPAQAIRIANKTCRLLDKAGRMRERVPVPPARVWDACDAP